MSHMVIYRGSDGKPGYHQIDDVHDAVAFVEQLRNDDGVEQARIFRLEEIGFEYRPYFRVELKANSALGAGAPAPAAVTSPTEPALASSPPPSAATSAPASSAATSTEPTASIPTASTPAAEPTAAPAAAPVVDTTPPAPTAESASSDPSEVADDSSSTDATGDNGVGARRGLFGR